MKPFSKFTLTISIFLLPCTGFATDCNVLVHTQYAVLTATERYDLFKRGRSEIDQNPEFNPPSFWPTLANRLEVALNVSTRLWGTSTSLNGPKEDLILPSELLSKLGIPSEVRAVARSQTREGTPIRSEMLVVSAGIMHTYGYLFSQFDTAYGLKSKRWIESKIDESLGLPANLISPFPSSGEFLSNLTWTLEQITQGKANRRSAAEIGNVGEELTRFENQLPFMVGYLEQNLGETEVKTYLIRLRKPTPSGETFLLANETVNKRDRRWITAFPVTEEFAKDIKYSDDPNLKPKFFIPRFNLVLEGRQVIRSQRWVSYYQGF